MMPMETKFRQLPGVDKVLSDERIKLLEKDYPRDLVVDLVRQ